MKPPNELIGKALDAFLKAEQTSQHLGRAALIEVDSGYLFLAAVSRRQKNSEVKVFSCIENRDVR